MGALMLGVDSTMTGTPPPSSRSTLEGYAASHPQFQVTSSVPALLSQAVTMARRVGGAVVDVGCGEGGTLAALRARFPDLGRAAGFELSSTRASIAGLRGCPVAVSDAMRLPVRRGSVALAVSRHVIEHVADDQAAADEVSAALAPGGVLYLETPMRLPGAWYPYRNPAGAWVLDPTHVREYATALEVTAVLHRAGLDCREVEIGPIRFPLGQLALRVPGVTRALGRRTAQIRDLRRPALRVPRYREVRCLALKP